MTEIKDTTHLYTNLAGNNELQKTSEIPGINGSQISISSLSFGLLAPENGTGTAWVIAIVDGVEKEIMRVQTDKTTYQPMSVNPAFIADTGKGVTLKWYLRSSSSKIKAKMQTVTYSYDYVLPGTPEEPEVKMSCVMIVCKNESDADTLAEELKEHVGDREIQILIQK